MRKKLAHFALFVVLPAAPLFAQTPPALQEGSEVEFPASFPGPVKMATRNACFLLAAGSITPGDVDWVGVEIPFASSRTVIDVDIAGAGSSFLFVSTGSKSGSNGSDGNNAADDLCGTGASSTPVGCLTDSVVDLGDTPIGTVVQIGTTGWPDFGLDGGIFHSETFDYEIWIALSPEPCTTDSECSDGVECTMDTCDVGSGDCTNTTEDTSCDNGVFCDGAETCDATAGCQAGTSPNCDDGVGCTADSCDNELAGCVNPPNDAVCENGIFCDGAETCDSTTDCQSGTPPTCDDGVSCTVDSCDTNADACDNAPNDGLCNDQTFCNGQETCDAINDCQSGTPPNCTDGVSCTADSCDQTSDMCVSTPNDAVCDNGMFCDGAEVCDAVNDCQPGTPPNCDDGVSCTNDGCSNELAECVNTPNDAACADNSFCNGAEFCDPATDCQPGSEPCEGSLCSEELAACVDCLTDTHCDDSLFCNGAETCNAPNGTCQAGPPPCPAGTVCNPASEQCEGDGGLRLDIKPGACPNKLSLKSRGFLQVALVATAGFDITDVDLSSLSLSRMDGVGGSLAPNDGPQGPGLRIEDSATPFDGEACGCSELQGDGVNDLMAAFDTEQMVSDLALGDLPGGAVVELSLSGTLLDGTSFLVSDCITIGGNNSNPRAAGKDDEVDDSQASKELLSGAASSLGCGGLALLPLILTAAILLTFSTARRNRRGPNHAT